MKLPPTPLATDDGLIEVRHSEMRILDLSYNMPDEVAAFSSAWKSFSRRFDNLQQPDLAFFFGFGFSSLRCTSLPIAVSHSMASVACFFLLFARVNKQIGTACEDLSDNSDDLSAMCKNKFFASTGACCTPLHPYLALPRAAASSIILAAG